MSEFKGISTTFTLDNRYASRTIVYLESEEDLSIIKRRWFHDIGENTEFRAARSSGCDSSGGCTVVQRCVERDRNENINAFGIVDRDALFREQLWDILWEIDDEVYSRSKALGKYITPILRWEIENYLIIPDVVEMYVADHENGRPLRHADVVTDELLDDCTMLIPLCAAAAVMHTFGKKFPNETFCSHIKDDHEMRSALEKILNSKLQGMEWENSHAAFVQRITPFDCGNDSLNRLSSLLKVVDGKRLLARIKTRHKIKDEFRYHLARKIKEQNQVPQELKNLIESFN